MCRRTSKGARRRATLAVACIAWLLPAGAALRAQSVEPFPLEPSTRLNLAELQELWIDWLRLSQQGELGEAEATLESLGERLRNLGSQSLPELAAAAAVEATAFAADGDFETAEAALDAAERLQPGAPETAFARATTARQKGAWLSAAHWVVRGGVRLISAPLTRRVVVANSIQWVLAVLALSAFSLIGLLMATDGRLLVEDLFGFISRSLPFAAALPLTLALLIWPVVLPSGFLWLALYWSVLLWGYGTRRMRVVVVVLWVFVGSLPVLATGHLRRLDFDMSAPQRALEDIASGRLTGAVFNDLGVVAALLPESVAFKQFRGDLHLQLRQWERARKLYREVLTQEGDSAAVLGDLGTVDFYDGDLDSAVEYLQQAAARPDASAEVYFNLSRALSEKYLFTESEAMLRRANSLDSSAVGDWISDVESFRVVRAAEGFARLDEISSDLEAVWERERSIDSIFDAWRKSLSIPLAVVLAGPAIGVFFLARRRGRRKDDGVKPWFGGGAERFRDALLPGLPEMENAHLGRAWCVLCLVLGLLILPVASGLTISLPLAYVPRISIGWMGVGAALVFLAALRFVLFGVASVSERGERED